MTDTEEVRSGTTRFVESVERGTSFFSERVRQMLAPALQIVNPSSPKTNAMIAYDRPPWNESGQSGSGA